MFSSVSHTAEDGTTYCYDFVFGGNCQTYIILKNNPSQVYWMWRKKKVVNENGTPKLVEIQRSLDDRLYSDDRMSVYENVIGDGFVTPGGLRAAKVCVCICTCCVLCCVVLCCVMVCTCMLGSAYMYRTCQRHASVQLCVHMVHIHLFM